LATFTSLVWPSAQRTVANSRGLPELNGAIAVTVPRANGPTLVGAAGPWSIASDYWKLLEKRTVSPFCRAALSEVAAMGQGGLQINEPGTSRSLKTLPGSWRDLALACLIHVGM
jgi:hypothetical protein